MDERRFQIGVFGSADGESVDKCAARARIMGDEISEYGCVLITGACPGLPHEVAKAAADRDVRIIGISPAMNFEEHMEKYQYPADRFYQLVFTGMERKGRNIISLRTCDAAIFIAGRIGTLNEFTIAYDEAREGFVIGILTDSGDLSDDLVKLAVKSGKKSKATIIEDDNPRFLIRRVLGELHDWQDKQFLNNFKQSVKALK